MNAVIHVVCQTQTNRACEFVKLASHYYPVSINHYAVLLTESCTARFKFDGVAFKASLVNFQLI